MIKVNHTLNKYAMPSTSLTAVDDSEPMLLDTTTPVLVETNYTTETDTLEFQMLNETTQDDQLNVIMVSGADSTASSLVVTSVAVTNNTSVTCKRIYAKNNSATVTKWALISTTGTTLYTSGKYSKGTTCTMDLGALNIPQNVEFKVKALVEAGKDSSSGTVLSYNANSRVTANFSLTGTAFHTSTTYTGSTY